MKTPKDLFECPESLPKRVLKILSKYEVSDLTYKKCEKLLAELEYTGYTFDYYLDAQPFNLRRIENKVVLIGKFFGVRSYSGENNELCVSFEITVEQTCFDKYGLEEEQLSRFRVDAYGTVASFVQDKIAIGKEVRIEGKLINNSYLNAYDHVVLSTVIESNIVELLD